MLLYFAHLQKVIGLQVQSFLSGFLPKKMADTTYCGSPSIKFFKIVWYILKRNDVVRISIDYDEILFANILDFLPIAEILPNCMYFSYIFCFSKPLKSEVYSRYMRSKSEEYKLGKFANKIDTILSMNYLRQINYAYKILLLITSSARRLAASFMGILSFSANENNWLQVA